jgi:hypothetical protein
VLIPDLTFYGLTLFIIPTVVFFAGLLTFFSGISYRPLKVKDKSDLIIGICIIGVSMILFGVPTDSWIICMLLVISAWMFTSSIVLLRRILHGRRAVPEGFISRLLISVVSFILAAIGFLYPVPFFYFFLDILGVLTMILGATILTVGVKLRRLMKITGT